MKVKDILTRYDGEFTVYKEVKNRSGIDYEFCCDFNSNWNLTNKFINKEVKDFSVGYFHLNIFIK